MSPNKWEPPNYPPPDYNSGAYYDNYYYHYQQQQQQQQGIQLPPISNEYQQFQQLNPMATLATLHRLTPTSELPKLSLPPKMGEDSKSEEFEMYQLYYEVSTRMYAWRLRNDNSTILGEENGTLVRVESSSLKEREKERGKSKIKPRSRDGCLTCRQRKKRCCERKPICNECERLGIKCRWPYPGSEHKNRRGSGGASGSGNGSGSENATIPVLGPDEMYHEQYGVIKVLRGVVEYRTDE